MSQLHAALAEAVGLAEAAARREIEAAAASWSHLTSRLEESLLECERMLEAAAAAGTPLGQAAIKREIAAGTSVPSGHGASRGWHQRAIVPSGCHRLALQAELADEAT